MGLTYPPTTDGGGGGGGGGGATDAIDLVVDATGHVFLGGTDAQTEFDQADAKLVTLDNTVAGLVSSDAVTFHGVIDASGNPNYPAGDAGDLYRISVAGKIGGASGVVVEVGDTVLCLVDSTAAGNQATVGSAWAVIQANIDGAVVGPASATDLRIAVFNGTTGKLISVGSQTLADIATAWAAGDTAEASARTTGDATVTTAFGTADAAVTTAYVAADTTVTNAYIAADKKLVTASTQTADYSVVAGDAGKRVKANKATAIAFTIDSSTAWAVDQVGEFLCIGAGQLTVVQGSGATLRNPGGLKSRVQYSAIRVTCLSSNEYLIDGDTTT